MTSDASLNLRVSRLENDIQSIYELITEIRATQQEHTRRFETLETTWNTRLETLETTWNTRFETLETTWNTRFEALDASLDTTHATLAEILRRLPEPS